MDDVRSKGIQSVEQASQLLEALIETGSEQSLTTLAKTAGMSPSSAHRYLTSLVRIGLVRQNASNNLYDLGEMAVRVGLAALARLDFIALADGELQALTQRVGVDGHVSVWGDHGPTIIRIRQTNSPILTNLRLGRTLPTLLSASGLVFCAHLPGKITAELVRREAAASGLTTSAVKTRITTVRNEGYASIDGSVIPGLRAIAAPVLGLGDQLVAVMALVGQSHDLVSFPNAFLDGLLQSAGRVSKALGRP